MIAFFLIVATLVFGSLAGLLGFYAYAALTDKGPDDFGALSFIGLGLSGLCFVFVVLTGLGVLATVQRFRTPEPTPIVRNDFDAWLTEHCKTCKQCNESMNRNPDVGLCEVAFTKMQESLRDQ